LRKEASLGRFSGEWPLTHEDGREAIRAVFGEIELPNISGLGLLDGQPARAYYVTATIHVSLFDGVKSPVHARLPIFAAQTVRFGFRVYPIGEKRGKWIMVESMSDLEQIVFTGGGDR
jgi:hypothetical protein